MAKPFFRAPINSALRHPQGAAGERLLDKRSRWWVSCRRPVRKCHFVRSQPSTGIHEMPFVSASSPSASCRLTQRGSTGTLAEHARVTLLLPTPTSGDRSAAAHLSGRNPRRRFVAAEAHGSDIESGRSGPAGFGRAYPARDLLDFLFHAQRFFVRSPPLTAASAMWIGCG